MRPVETTAACGTTITKADTTTVLTSAAAGPKEA
jgi:hypothetical protein